MRPTTTHIFVKETKTELKKNDFQYVDNSRTPNYEVIAVGPDVKLCSTGDFVLLNNAHRTDIDGEEVFVMDESDLIGVKDA
jgi:co-chaperonin GroES (HSP10)